jgi:hypothetical protein
MTEPKSPEFGVLRQEFLGKDGGDSVQIGGWERRWPSRDKIVGRIKEKNAELVKEQEKLSLRKRKKKSIISIPNDAYSDLRAGQPVPWALLAIAAELMDTVPDAIADPTDDRPPDRRGWWERPYKAMFTAIGAAISHLLQMAGKFPALAHFKKDDESDLYQAARIILDWLGRNCAGKEDVRLSEEEAIRCGEQHTRRSLQDIVEFFRRLAAFDSRCLKFTVVSDKNGKEMRVGLTVFVPLSEDAYSRFRSGEMEPPDLKSSDFQRRSPYLLWLGAFEVSSAVFGDRNATSDRQVYTLVRQLAEIYGRRRAVTHHISLCGTPRSKRRLLVHGFEPTGTTTPQGVEIVELGPTPAGASQEALERHKDSYANMNKLFDAAQWLAIAMLAGRFRKDVDKS